MRHRGFLLLALVAASCEDERELHAPALESSSPPYGPLVGGTEITLNGSGFLSDGAVPNRVLIAGREAPLARALDDSRLVVVIPPGERTGDAEIVVLNRNGNAHATGIFHYSTPPAITSVAPANVLFSSVSTVATVTGHGFLDEGAGIVDVVVGGVLATDVQVISDTQLTFTIPAGRALVRPTIDLANLRGKASKERAFRYVPSARGGLLLFGASSAPFAVFFDPVDRSIVAIDRVGPFQRWTAVVVDDQGDYWALDRGLGFGRIDMNTQTMVPSIQLAGWFPAMVRLQSRHVAIDRSGLRLVTIDPATGQTAQFTSASIPCCGSYGLAVNGGAIYFTARSAGVVSITSIDPVNDVISTPVPITGAAGLHVEDMRFFDGNLYAASRNGTVVRIDPLTGATEVVASQGRFTAMEVFAPVLDVPRR